MGWFDGLSAGWNSFVENELNTTKNVLLSPNPVVKAILDPQAAIDNPSSLLPSTTDQGLEESWNEVKDDYVAKVERNVDILTSPNPLISAATGHADDILDFGKSAGEKWDNVTNTVNDEVVKPIDETVVQPIIKETEKITETVKETVNNVTKGVGDALPIVAIGAAAVIGLSILFGRK